jgi:CheY-like chemotaxis protein
VAKELRTFVVDMPLLIAFSGYGEPEHVQRSYEAGFDYHLVKPVKPSGLQTILEEYADSRHVVVARDLE